MRLDTFFIADAVTPAQDGKFNVLGGGLTRFEVPEVPFPMTLAVVIRIEVSDEELLASSHKLSITLRGPLGVPNIPTLEIQSGPEESLDPILEGEQRFLQLGMSLPAQVIRLGLYHLELEVDGDLLGSIRLPVTKGESAQVLAIPQQVASHAPASRRATTKRPPPPPKKAKHRR